MNQPKILYFVKGAPDEAELAEASASGALFRNCLAWHENDAYEPCDQVMGKFSNIPEPYKHLWKETETLDKCEKPPVKPRSKKGGKNAAGS